MFSSLLVMQLLFYSTPLLKTYRKLQRGSVSLIDPIASMLRFTIRQHVGNRATQCALELQKSHCLYYVDDILLSIHIGVSCGSLSYIYVGGVECRWEFLVAGSPLSQLEVRVVLRDAYWRKDGCCLRLCTHKKSIYV